MSTFRNALDLASNATAPSVEPPSGRRSSEATTSESEKPNDLGNLSEQPANPAPFVFPFWAAGESSNSSGSLYTRQYSSGCRSSLLDPSIGYTIGGSKRLWEEAEKWRKSLDPSREIKRLEALEKKSTSQDQDEGVEEEPDSDLFGPDSDGISGENDDQLQESEKPRFKDNEAFKDLERVPSPTESQLISSNFQFHRGLTEKEIQSRFSGRALRGALKDVVPALSRKEQWYAWKKALGHEENEHHTRLNQPNAGSNTDPYSDNGIHKSGEHTEDPSHLSLESIDENGRTSYKHEFWDWSGVQLEDPTSIQPIVYDNNGNPFGGNARSKYLAATGFDLVDLAHRWNDDPAIDPVLKSKVERRAEWKMMRFRCDQFRDPRRATSEDMAYLQELDVPSRIMYLTWPGPYAVAQIAVDEYAAYLEDRDISSTDSDNLLLGIRELTSEKQLERLMNDGYFWGNFSQRMGLLTPHEPSDELPEEWFNDASVAYLGPVIYLDMGAEEDARLEWQCWHGPDLDQCREKRSIIELIDSVDFQRHMGSLVLKQQYHYLQGLSPSSVKEYHEAWKQAVSGYFSSNQLEIYGRWGWPLGQDMAQDQPLVGDQHHEQQTTSDEARELVSQQPHGPMTPDSSSPGSPLPAQFPGLAYFSRDISRMATPIPLERPPIDVVDIGPQTSHKNTESIPIGSNHHRQSSPPYTEFSREASSTPSIDTDMSDDLLISSSSNVALNLTGPPSTNPGPLQTTSIAPEDKDRFPAPKEHPSPAEEVPKLISLPPPPPMIQTEPSRPRTPTDEPPPPPAPTSSALPRNQKTNPTKRPARMSSRAQTRSRSRSRSTNRIEKPCPARTSTAARAISTKVKKTVAGVGAAPSSSATSYTSTNQPSSSKVKDAVKKLEEVALQADGSPPRRSQRLRNARDGPRT